MLRARGGHGELRAVYHVAARLRLWSLTMDTSVCGAPTFDVEASVTTSDEYWRTYDDLTLVLVFGDFEWTWKGVRPKYAEDYSHVALRVYGRPELKKLSIA